MAKKQHQHRWYVPEDALLAMIESWREARVWEDEINSWGISIDRDEVIYDPTDLILAMLDVPKCSDGSYPDHFYFLTMKYEGTTLQHMRELFAEILKDAHG